MLAMKKIDYPLKDSAEYVKLTKDYMSLFAANLANMESRWSQWKADNHVATIPESVADLLVAEVDKVADVYDRFIALGIPSKQPSAKDPSKMVRSDEFKDLDKIFAYSSNYDSIIADFFMEHAAEFHITTCHYCEMAYINTYVLPIRHGASATSSYRRQFDVDHFLPKTTCPIIGLSLFNFVPSCQVCNSRIKLANVLGDNKAERIAFNPANESYELDKYVTIRLRMWRKPSTTFRNHGDYYIYFRCKNGYRKAIDFFHLEERYEFHKSEAMRLKLLKAKYPESTIRKISALLGKPVSEIREDLFHKKFLEKHDRCFAKLTRDILK